MSPIGCSLIAAVLALAATATASPAATVTIVMQDLEISPAEASARVGDTVQWVNKDVFAHTATATNGDFDVMLPPKATASHVVVKPGAVDYYCRFHPNMRARINVVP